MKKLHGSLIVAVLFSLILSGLVPQRALGQAGPTGTGSQVLRLTQYSPDTIDPSFASYTHEVRVINSLFAGLVKLDVATNEVVPDLAEIWSWNTSTNEITFVLRSGLLWSDGQPLTAADARFAILREMDPALDTVYAGIFDPILNAYEYRTGAITNPDLVGVYVDDATHLRIKLKQPMIFFEKVMALWVAKPLPQHVISQHPDDWTYAAYIATSGPYDLSGWDYLNSMHLAANPNYYGSAPGYSEIAVQFVTDDTAIWDAYMQGNLDTMDLTAVQYQVAQADPVLAAQSTLIPGTCTYTLAFKTDVSPMDNANVRRALIAAVDRAEFAGINAGGSSLATQTWTPPTVWGYVDGEALGIGIPFDVTQAQTYLTSAGYDGGVGFPEVIIEVRDSPRNRQRWDGLAAYWQTNLNITIILNYVDYIPDPQPINFLGWCADYNEAYNFVADGVFNSLAPRLGGWSNPAYIALMDQISQQADPATRLALYEDAEQILVEDDAVIGPLFNTMVATLTKPYLQRTISSFNTDYWYEWTLIMEAEEEYDPATALNFAPGVDTTAYELPANAFDQPMTLIHTALRPDEAITPPSYQMGGIGHAFNFTAQPHAIRTGIQSETLAPYNITILYSLEQVVAGQIDEASLVLYAWVNGVWVPQATTVDSLTHELTVETSQVDTNFAVFGESTLQFIFLPSILR